MADEVDPRGPKKAAAQKFGSNFAADPVVRFRMAIDDANGLPNDKKIHADAAAFLQLVSSLTPDLVSSGRLDGLVAVIGAYNTDASTTVDGGNHLPIADVYALLTCAAASALLSEFTGLSVTKARKSVSNWTGHTVTTTQIRDVKPGPKTSASASDRFKAYDKIYNSMKNSAGTDCAKAAVYLEKRVRVIIKRIASMPKAEQNQM